MSKTRWTKEQQDVINSRGGNLLVAAAAGSGKTAVLVERIITMITDPINPIDIDKLLVVTFTNAAAAEMKERVQLAIEKLIQSNGENGQLKRQLLLLEQANITTIHSFCLNVIKEHFYKLNLKSDFRIGSEQECSILKRNAMDQVFDELYKEEDSNFHKLVDHFGSTRGDENIRQLLLNMYNFVIASPTPTKWLDDSAEEFNITDDFNYLSTKSGQSLIENIKIEFSGVIESMEMIIEQVHGIAELQQYYIKYVNELYQFRELEYNFDKSWDDIKSSIDKIQYEDYRKGVKRLPASTDISIKKLQKDTKKIRDDCKDTINSFKNEIFFRTEMDIKDELQSLYPIVKAMSEILKRFINTYQLYKREQGIIDFNDIEHFAIDILTEKDGDNLIPSEIAKIYAEQFEEIFIDEYQDSNLTQELLLSSISKNNNNRFMVGDVKQSIYKFRQARPDIFLEKYDNYTTDLSQSNKKILLHKNFRSRGEVLDATNYIFEHIMKQDVGGLEYGESERLNLGGHFKPNTEVKSIVGGAAELHLIHNGSEIYSNEDNENSASTEKEELDKIQKEARVIGNIINDLLCENDNGEIFKVIDKKTGEYRNARFGDIVILLRSLSRWQEIIGQELNKMGIPVAITSASGYLNSLEVRMSIDILKAINNLYDNISLVAALRSQFFNFTIDELILIRDRYDDISFYELLIRKSLESNALGTKCKDAIDKLNTFSLYSKNNSIRDTLEFIYDNSGYYTFVSTLSDGNTRRTNIELLLERCDIFNKNNEPDIYSFIKYIEELIENDLDLEGAKPNIDLHNSVNLMTIHKSKGLEFPIVICAGMGKQFNTMDLKNPLLYHSDLGYGPQIYALDKRITYPSIVKESLKSKMTVENLAEEIRILYVALTRPKEKLILTGMVNNLNTALEKWGRLTYTEGRIPAYGILKSNCYLDWIVPSLLKHKDFKEFRDDYQITDVIETPHKSTWQYKIWNANDLPTYSFNSETDNSNNIEQIRELELTINKLKHFTQIEVNEKMILPKTLTVTDFIEMKTKNDTASNTYELLVPNFQDEKNTFTAMQIGTIFHEVMQKIELKAIDNIQDVSQELERLIKRGLLLEEEAKVINKKSIVMFVKSSLGQRLIKSTQHKREQPISICVNNDDINIRSNHSGDILINGVIDTYFEEDNELVIIDYKTDYVDDSNIEDVINNYTIQLELYKKALEKITNKNVKECYLHLFSKGESIKII